MKLTPTQIKEIEYKCKMATKGPWKVDPEGMGVSDDEGHDVCDLSLDLKIDLQQAVNNWCFIASARTDIPALIEDREEMEIENKDLHDSLQSCLNRNTELLTQQFTEDSKLIEKGLAKINDLYGQ